MIAVDSENDQVISYVETICEKLSERKAVLFGRAVINAGLDAKQVVCHTLRHTATPHLLQAGVVNEFQDTKLSKWLSDIVIKMANI